MYPCAHQKSAIPGVAVRRHLVWGSHTPLTLLCYCVVMRVRPQAAHDWRAACETVSNGSWGFATCFVHNMSADPVASLLAYIPTVEALDDEVKATFDSTLIDAQVRYVYSLLGHGSGLTDASRFPL